MRLALRLALAVSPAYPADQATGFAAGEMRGFLWAEVRKQDP
jgi:hypothetical protein